MNKREVVFFVLGIMLGVWTYNEVLAWYVKRLVRRMEEER